MTGLRPVDWRRNLGALWFAEFTAIVGFSFAFPFIPLYLRQDLGVHTGQALALWTGLAASVTGFSLAFFSPIWGALADRYGRKSMLVRAMIGGGLTVGLMGLARGPIDLVVLRFIQGASSGTIAAATALLTSETPRERVGWALGVLSSAVALGGAVGPLIGGVAAAFFGLRVIFLTGGVLLLAASIPVIAVVRETPLRRGAGDGDGAMAAIRARGQGTLAVVVALLVAQSLMQISYSAAQQLVVLRLLEFLSRGAETVTGLAFGAAGLATGIAAVTYSFATRRAGYKRVAAVAAVLFGGSIAAAAVAPSVALVVVAVAVFGLVYGALNPSLSSMLGLEAPAQVQGRVFGASASAIALGFAFGPLIGGAVAATVNVRAALLVAAAVSVALSGVVAAGTREPAR